MTEINKQRFIIIDGNAIVHRAYHALPPMTTKEGNMVNAVYGFTSMLLKVINDLKPTHLAVSFDLAEKTFRDKIYAEYKATRVKADQELYDQIPIVYKVVEAFDIPIYVKAGYEADDVIGTVACQIQNPKSKIQNESTEVIIVTGDKDLLQLVDENTKVYLLRKGLSQIEMFGNDEVKKLFGFGPELVVDYKALRGDASDNIPGVRGIGEKTATELIVKVGGVDEIYGQIQNPKSKIQNEFSKGVIKKLTDDEKGARMSKELATIKKDVPDLEFDLEKCKVNAFDEKKIGELLRRLEFFSLIKRIPRGGQSIEIPNSKFQIPNKSQITNSKAIKLTTLDKDKIGDLVREIKKAKIFACKEILNGKDILNGKLLGFVFEVNGKSYYLEGWHEELKKIFSEEKILLIGHDLKKLIKVFLFCHSERSPDSHQGVVEESLLENQNNKLKINLEKENNQHEKGSLHSSRDSVGMTTVRTKLFDTMIASYIVDSSTRAHDLKSIINRELNQEMPAGSDQSSLFGADPKMIAQELNLINQLYFIYKNKLEKMDDQGLFDKIEMALIPVLAEMELNGVAVDVPMLNKLSADVAKAIGKVTEKIWDLAGKEFNIASSLQLRDILFDTLKLPTQGIKKGKTGFSSSASELEKLRDLHPIIPLIEEHRELAKLQSTYVDVLPTLINPKTNRIHTTFNQAVTTTGRLSCSEPNLQNIPIRTELGREVRNTFIAEDGYNLVVADYSQIELRIVASLAQDEKMIEIFEKGEDIHRATAAAINGVSLDNVTKEMRNAAKEVNFGVLYGMGAYGLSWRAGIPQAEAKNFITKYFTEFAGVKKYLDQTLAFAKKEGYVETLFGRRRYLPELKSGNFQLRSAGERMAINMPVQGTAADLMKLAMIEVDEKIKRLKIKDCGDVKLILQVHDELVLEVKKGREDEVSKLVKDAMENVVKLRVPVEVHVSVGKRWGELK
jgi:DNA polymerase-1